jgi:probable HAF family extracellular repeat protein
MFFLAEQGQANYAIYFKGFFMNTVLRRAAWILLGTSALVGSAHTAMAQLMPNSTGALQAYSSPTELPGDDGLYPFSPTLDHTISSDGTVIVGANGFWRYDSATETVPTVPANVDFYRIAAVSGDGTTIVGKMSYADEGIRSHAVIWHTGETGWLRLPDDVGKNSQACAVSEDGSVIVGDAQGEDGNSHAVVWNDEKIKELGREIPRNSTATAVSADGSTIVGTVGSIPSGMQIAVAWFDGETTTELDNLRGNYSAAHDVSENGSVIVGESALPNGHYHAVAWFDKTGRITDLGTLIDGAQSTANAVSADGTVIVGAAGTADSRHAVEWRNREKRPTDLNTLGGKTSEAHGVSGNGSVIVGGATNKDEDMHAAAWIDGATVPVDLGALGENNSFAQGVSADGSVIIGQVGGTYIEGGMTGGRPVLWKVLPPPPPSPPPPPPIVVIDVINTMDTVAMLAHDTFSVMESQRATLGRLQTSCDVWKAGESCYSISTDIGKAGNSKDMLGWMTLGHAFTDNFSAVVFMPAGEIRLLMAAGTCRVLLRSTAMMSSGRDGFWVIQSQARVTAPSMAGAYSWKRVNPSISPISQLSAITAVSVMTI